MEWITDLYARLEQVEKPVLYWSSGLDSTVLLAVLRQQPKEFDIWQSRDLWTKEQREYSDALITKWDLRVFEFPPQGIYFIGNDEQLTAVFDYANGMPMLKDVVESSQCIGDIEPYRMDYIPFKWDLHIAGSRREDSHYAYSNNVIPSKEWETPSAKFYAPLFDVKRETILELAKEYDVEVPAVEMDLEICTNCLSGKGKVHCPKDNVEIDSVVWNRKANLDLFRQRQNVSVK